MKDLTPSAWESFIATHRPGDVVRGKASRFTSFGVFVELGEGLEGLCHISELSDERVEKPEDVVQLGQEADFRILRIENADQKIGLSFRAVGKDDEPIIDTRSFSSEAKSGMASLGELANLLGGEPAEAPEPELTKEEKEEAKRLRKEQARKEYEEAAAREAAAAEEQKASTVTEDAAVEETSSDVSAATETAEEAITAQTEEAAEIAASPEESHTDTTATDNAAEPETTSSEPAAEESEETAA